MECSKKQTTGNVVRRDRTGRVCSCPDITYVVESNGEYAGKLCMRKLNFIFTEYIHLVVEEKFRGQGLAKLLNHKLFEVSNTPFGFATVKSTNSKSYNLLTGIGFKPMKEIVSPISQEPIIILTIDLFEWKKERGLI